jgi:ABC-type sugar transport system ATPase subunit
LSKEKASAAEKHILNESKDQFVRLGIRCEYIIISDKKMSDNSFQLPVYAVAHEAESSIVTFELENSFLHSRVGKGKGYDTCRSSEQVWLDFNQEYISFFEKTVELSKA